MGISIRAYARSRHISDTAVRKAIKTGRVSLEADGTIDPSRADAEWRNNTDSAQQRKKAGASSRPVSNEAIASVRETLSESSAPGTGGTTFLQARTANEVLKAQTNKVRLAKLKGELVNRAQAMAHVFKLARTERDAWLNWPSRISAQMAAELNVDAHRLHVMLEKAVRTHLAELGEMRACVD
jgi:hypothetical protein